MTRQADWHAMLGEHTITPAAAKMEAAQPGHQTGAAWGVAPTAEAAPHVAASAVAPDDDVSHEPRVPLLALAWAAFTSPIARLRARVGTWPIDPTDLRNH